MRASSRSLRSREQKPKIFLTFLLFLGGGCGGSRQKMERKFLVLLRRFRLQNELSLFYHFSLYRVAHFSVFAARRGAPISAFCDNSNVRSHFANTSHRPFAFAHDACSVLASCSLCGFVQACGDSKKRIVPNPAKWHKQIILHLPQPSHAHASVAPL